MNYDKKLGLPDIFTTRDFYRLELRWKNVIYANEGDCEIVDAYFSGPVLKHAEKIEQNSFMLLDFYKQYYVFAKNAYIATFSWGEVIYNKDNTISLKNTHIKHDTELNKVPKLNSGDYIIIDTIGHEKEIHDFNLTYNTYVLNENEELYNFWDHHHYKIR